MGRHESVCPYCGDAFVAIGRHWSQGDCDYPPISGRKKELMAGLLAGDASIREQRDRDDGKAQKFPGFELELTEGEFVEWVADVLDPFTSNITTRDHDDNRQQTTRMYTVGHPVLQEAAFNVEMDRPSSLPFGFGITPTILNAIYCTRGGLHWVDGGANVRLHPRPQYRHLLERFLREQGWGFTIVRDGEFYFRRADTEAFFEYIGEPFPGFEWKWHSDDEDAYREGVVTPAKPLPEPEPDPDSEPERDTAGHEDVLDVSVGRREGKKVHILRERSDGYYERVCGRHDDGMAFGRASREMTADRFLRLSNRCLQCERYADLPDEPKRRTLDFDPVEAGLLGDPQGAAAEPAATDSPAPATVNLEPDWENVAEQLERMGFPGWAEDARQKRLTKRELYGPVLNLLYRGRYMNPPVEGC